jgi:hypothetical protein
LLSAVELPSNSRESPMNPKKTGRKCLHGTPMTSSQRKARWRLRHGKRNAKPITYLPPMEPPEPTKARPMVDVSTWIV